MGFRPCIDLREGKVVQIVGGSLDDNNSKAAQVNFETERLPEYYAGLYRADKLSGGHVISLGKGNRDAAVSALRAYPGGLHAGGGINPDNAFEFLDAGASHVIVTSYVFSEGKVNNEKLRKLSQKVGKERLVLDLSCRKREEEFLIVTDRWQKFTDVTVGPETLDELSGYCDEFLVHGVDVEGKRQGIQEDLVRILGKYSPIPVTYAGGVRSLTDMDLIMELGEDRVDATIGSSLDIFGGDIPYREVVKWHMDNVKE